MSGIFVSKGMTFALTDLVLSTEPGQSTAKTLLHYDVCPVWLELAVEHLKAAREASQARNDAWTTSNDKLKGPTLEREFKAAMQAITCAAIAWDAFYAAVREKANIDPEIWKKWRSSGTARYKQVAETLRLVFELPPAAFETIRDGLRQIYRFRDRAVHPTGSLSEAVTHPELGVGVEERFVLFSYDNAHGIVQATVEIIDELVSKAARKTDSAKNYLDALKIATNRLRTSDEFSMVPKAYAS